MRHLKKHLSFANVLSCMALFVALGGVAFAAKATLTRKAVKTRHIANGAVTALKLRNGAVTTPKLRNGAVVATKIASGQIGSSQLSDGGVRSSDLGGGVVTEPKIKNGAVTEPKLGGGAVSTGKIQDGAVTGAKLSSSFSAQLVKNVSNVVATTLSSATSPKSVTAECPPGKHVLGGGARIAFGTAESATITESVPAVKPHPLELLTGWTASARTSDPGTWAIEAVAICAEF